MQLQSIGTYETKTHLAEILRRVQQGEGFTITQRGEPVADLVPAGSSARRISIDAAVRMREFMQAAPLVQPGEIEALIQSGRD